MNVDHITEPIAIIYGLLGQLQEIVKIIESDFSVKTRELDMTIKLPQPKVDELKAKYKELQEELVRQANRIPKVERIG